MAVFALLLFAFWVVAGPDYDKLRALAEQRYGELGRDAVLRWQQMLTRAAALSEREKLLQVNDFFNRRIAFRTDTRIWGDTDYWATPLETLGRQQGDCEDFSIAKYVSLLELGISIDKLRLTYVKARTETNASQAHMVLAYYPSPSAEPLILDNLSREIMLASKRTDLTPVFSFNSAGLWVGQDQQSRVAKPETRLSRWRDVLTRMQAEGLR